jgi:hypothetical protein
MKNLDKEVFLVTISEINTNKTNCTKRKLRKCRARTRYKKAIGIFSKKRSMIYTFIENHENIPIEKEDVQILLVGQSYYQWKRQSISDKKQS